MPSRITFDCATGQTEQVEMVGPELTGHQLVTAQLIVFSGDDTVRKRLRTIDANATEIYRLPLAQMTGYVLFGTLLGVDAGNGNVRMIRASVVAKRLGGGALQVGAPVTIANHQDAGASTWAISAAVSGNDLVVSVTGQAGRSIDWLLDARLTSFTPAGA
jgi:hypothetical protein